MNSQQDFNPTEDNNENQDNYNSKGQDDFDFEGAPLFSNNSIGATAYPSKDKNGEWYLRLQLPLVGNVNLFVNDGAHEGLKQSFGKLVDHFNQK